MNIESGGERAIMTGMDDNEGESLEWSIDFPDPNKMSFSGLQLHRDLRFYLI